MTGDDRCCAPTQQVFELSGSTSAPPNQNPNQRWGKATTPRKPEGKTPASVVAGSAAGANNPPANSEPEGAASENEPHSPAGQVESIEDAPPGAPHNERTLRNAQSVYNVLNAVLGFTGLMSGFEGFIINEYVNADGKTEDGEDFSITFEIGFFFMAGSFALNVAASIWALLAIVFLHSGFYRDYFRWLVGRCVMAMATMAVCGFCVSVLMFLWTTGIRKEFLFTIYALSALMFVGIGHFFVTTTQDMMNEDVVKSNQILAIINGSE